ncbi:hypothetical protein A4X09_0g399 [Tilletia walkeri]|uniref:Uncharacterized protein n=1 Tax=Tilletia walkeri TaxID=117179 RepID=A0A8X7NET9_9BASI|nr:hypothetical protein A4X09_0g399 [Tilletia walkeri]
MSSSDQVKSILLFGATGYLGGNVLYNLLKAERPAHIVLLVSSKSAAEKVGKWARSINSNLDVQILQPAQGQEGKEDAAKRVRPNGLDIVPIPRDPAQAWYDAAQHYASQTDCAVQLATSDDHKLTQAIQRGLADAHASGSRRGCIVHASGTQLIESAPVGKDVETPIYDDTDLAALRSIPDEAAHRMIDLEIINDIAAGKIGGGAVVCPSLIWGLAHGPVRRISQQVPGMVEKALSPINNQAVYCGEGTNVWNGVHVDDLADFIVSLINRWTYEPLPSSPPEAHSTFYFAAAKPLFSFKEVATAIGTALSTTNNPSTSKPLLPTAEPKSVPVPKYDASQKGVRVEDGDRAAEADEDEKRAPAWPCRTCSRCVSKRAEKEFGWVAKREFTREAMVDEVKTYVKVWAEDGVLDEKLKA